MAGFQELVRFILDGEDVKSGVANRAPRVNDQNVRYLRDLIEAALLGQALKFLCVTVETETKVGMPVYWNPSTQRFERGLAGTQVEPTTGAILTSASSLIWGVVTKKYQPGNKADITLFGIEKDFDFSGAIPDGDEQAAGLYYLSGQTAGFVTRQRPPVSVPVFNFDGFGTAFINPQIKDFLNDHTHHRFDLAAVPAGSHSPPIPGERHVITSPDDSIEGWLPASHSSFDGKAPSGAAFGYNIKANAQLDNLWPPIPLNDADLQWDRGEDKDLGLISVPQGAEGLVIINRDGIWWMSDCYDDVPWPTTLDTATSDSSSVSESDSIECPRELDMRLILWFTRISFATDRSVVTSLTSIDPRLIIRCLLDGNPGSTGDLTIDLDLLLGILNTDQEGFTVFKELEEGGQFRLGPVVEGLFAGNSRVSLTSTANQDVNGDTLHQGRVTIQAFTQPTLEVDIKLVRLDNATEEIFKEVPFIGLNEDKTSQYIGKLKVPDDLDLTLPKLALRFQILGKAIGTFPDLTLTARTIPRADAGQLALPIVSAVVGLTTSVAITAANNYIEAESDKIDVVAGDIVIFQLTRASGDAYAGQMGILDQVGVLSSGS